MNLLAALTVGILFGVGVKLILRRNLIEITLGTMMLSNASFVFIVAAGFGGYHPPVLPLNAEAAAADPLVQALVLTAMVISFGVTAFLLALVYRFHRHHASLDQGERPNERNPRHQPDAPRARTPGENRNAS